MVKSEKMSGGAVLLKLIINMQLNIEKMVYGGYGLARTEDGVILVENVLPGEVVKADIINKKGGVPVGFPFELIEVSPHRKEPCCKYVGECGGCDWQHIEYTQQLIYKRDIFIDCLTRIGKIKDIPEIEIISSPEWEYRIRAQLKVDVEKGCMGFFRRKTNDVISIDNCPLLDPQINVLLKNQREIIPALPKKSKQLKVIAGTNNSITSKPNVAGFTQSEAVINVGKVEFIVTGNSFFQGNGFLLEKLGTWAEPSVSGKFFIDMFGGLGFFSIMLGKKFSSGLLVESLEMQTELAKRNFVNNGIDHITVKAILAETFFDKESNKIPKPDLIIVDPPRPGLTRMVREGIRDLEPSTLLYVSCNPSTQARDVEFFVNKCGYVIERGALFDLYPQTHHMETVLLLRSSIG